MDVIRKGVSRQHPGDHVSSGPCRCQEVWSRVTQYDILTAGDSQQLKAKVNERIAGGWQPYGMFLLRMPLPEAPFPFLAIESNAITFLLRKIG